MEIKELIKKAIQTAENKEKLSSVLSELILENSSEWKVFCELYDFVYGDTLCDEKCVEWVNKMHSGSESGKKWSIEQTNELARRLDIDFGSYTPYEFWAVYHMMYYDYRDALKRSAGVVEELTFAKFAKAFLEDEDAVGDKLKEYYFHIACLD